ncbi:DUF4867 family protein [Caloramator sp. mosi_1]
MDIQIGYCNGNNFRLNALEYHKGSENKCSSNRFSSFPCKGF